ncbi:hypothetical protein HYW44_00450 [Candidatus Daviesbacteria bacterium]|nr:hypothetical protein [Candidatus Daviesbacteria bacterium]
MSAHIAEAIIITCIDFRFQEYINKWIGSNLKPGAYDRGAFAGAAKSLETILNQIDVSYRLHHIKKAVLINHEDCGAYGEDGHIDRHVEDLQKARKHIMEKIPDLEVETYYLHLDGTFEKV